MRKTCQQARDGSFPEAGGQAKVVDDRSGDMAEDGDELPPRAVNGLRLDVGHAELVAEKERKDGQDGAVGVEIKELEEGPSTVPGG